MPGLQQTDNRLSLLCAVGPWDASDLAPGLAVLAESARSASARMASDAVVLAELAKRVPRLAGDERGPSAWTSFLREVAVARRCSDRAARAEVAFAVQLQALPRAGALLQSGQLPVMQARALVEECYGAADSTLGRIDDEVSGRAVSLSPSRVRDAVRKVVLREEADAAAVAGAKATALRSARRTALRDDQAEIALTGPAVPLAQAWEALDADARALRAAGDGRTLDALRFDLAVDRLLGGHVSRGLSNAAGGTSRTDQPLAAADVGSPPVPATGGPQWLADRRWGRPVRLNVQVPVTTLLGLANEPGWLDGHGWVSAPACRQLLVSAELRRLCVDERTGRLVDLAERVVRPERTPLAAGSVLREMGSEPCEISGTVWQTEEQHDPGERLSEFIVLRDGLCDGPTGARIPARRAQLDHEVAWPQGPTAAWNLVARGERTHLLKHRGWRPVRTATGTLWFSPAGQVVQVEHTAQPLQPLEAGAVVPDPDALHELDAELLRPPTADDDPPDW